MPPLKHHLPSLFCYCIGFSELLTQLLVTELDTMSRRTLNVNREKLFTDEEKLERKQRIFEQLSEFLIDEAKSVVKEPQILDSIDRK